MRLDQFYLMFIEKMNIRNVGQNTLTNMLSNVIIRREQVNLLVYGPDRPYFKQKQKKILKHFGQLACFFTLLFSAFCKNSTYIRNKNQ